MQFIRRLIRIIKSVLTEGISLYIWALAIGIFLYLSHSVHHKHLEGGLVNVVNDELPLHNNFLLSDDDVTNTSSKSPQFNDVMFLNKSAMFLPSSAETDDDEEHTERTNKPQLPIFSSALQRSILGNYKLSNISTKLPSEKKAGLVGRRLVTSPPAKSLLFRKKRLVLWVNGMNKASTRDLRNLLGPLGVRFVDWPRAPDCSLQKCGKDLTLDKRRELYDSMTDKFFESHKDEKQVQMIDGFVCVDPPADCEFFVPFGKSLIILAAYRYEAARIGLQDWQVWNENLIKIAREAKNVVASTSVYYANYIRYFTGIKPDILQSFNGYLEASYKPTRQGLLLISPGQIDEGINKIFSMAYLEACEKLSCPKHFSLKHFRVAYREPSSRDLASHHGLVYIPLRMSSSSVFEHYRMNIPMFFPSIQLLIRWQQEYSILSRDLRTTEGSPLQGQDGVPDPNRVNDVRSLQHWLQMADFYNMPYINLFESAEDLVRKLLSLDLQEVSRNMQNYNSKAKEIILHNWRQVLHKVAHFSDNDPV